VGVLVLDVIDRNATTPREIPMTDRVRLWDKCNALAAACVARGMVPTITRVALLYSVAQHETQCGDAWPGEHNWGATTRRSLTAGEQHDLATAGIHPVLSPAAARVAAERAASDLLGLGPGSDVAIHADSRPPNVVYFTMFARFEDDVAGATYFVGFFRTTAEKAALDGQSPEALARAMFHAGYYTGFHKDDPEANIADYARALAPIFAGAVTGLQGWTPGADAPHVSEPAGWQPDTPERVKALQNALNRITPHPYSAILKVDGLLGDRTRAALAAYRALHDIASDEAAYVALGLA